MKTEIRIEIKKEIEQIVKKNKQSIKDLVEEFKNGEINEKSILEYAEIIARLKKYNSILSNHFSDYDL